MITKEKVFSNIESVHQQALTAPQQFFNAILCELFEEMREQGLEEILDSHALVEKDRDMAPLKQFEEKVLGELRSSNHLIEEYYQQNNLKLPEGFMCPPGISEFRAYDEGILISRAAGKNDTISLEDTKINGLIFAVSASLSSLMYNKIPQEEIWALAIRLAIVNTEKDTNKKVIKLRDFSSTGLYCAYDEIREFIAANQIINTNLKISLEQLREYRDKEAEYKESSMHIALIGVLQILLTGRLCSAHHIKFVQRFASLDNNGNILELKIGQKITVWEAEKTDLERRKSATFWYSWEQFKQFYAHYRHHSRHKTAARNDGNYLLEQDLHTESEILYQTDTLREHERRVFNKIQKILHINIEKTVSISSDSQKIKLYSKSETTLKEDLAIFMAEDSSHVTFSYGTMSQLHIKKGKDSNRFKLTSVLKKGQQRSFKEAYKLLTGIAIDGQLGPIEIKDVTNSIKDFNKLFKKELGVSAILKIKGEVFYPNPKYKILYLK